ncbi:MAG: hypothetical protein ACPLXP_02320 [Microgenomates group bacterium]
MTNLILNPGVTFKVKNDKCLVYINFAFSYLQLEGEVKDWFLQFVRRGKLVRIPKDFIDFLFRKKIIIYKPEFL